MKGDNLNSMPYYEFLNEKTGETKNIFFNMNDKKEYIDNDGYQWIRQFISPNASINSKIDPFDHKKSLEKLKETRGTIGDMQDFSKEQSLKRADKLGHQDPVRQKFYDKYAAERGGKRHIEERKELLQKNLKDAQIKIKSKLK